MDRQLQENYLSAPTLEKFGLDDAVYDDYKTERQELENTKTEQSAIVKSVEINWSINLILVSLYLGAWFASFCLLYLLTIPFKDVLWVNDWIPILLFIVGFYGPHFILYRIDEKLGVSKFIRNLFTLGKYNKTEQVRQRVEQEIENLEKTTKEKVGPFEKAFHDYHQEQLDNFYAARLYRKHSGTSDFERSLGEFGLMLKTLASANKTLLTNHFWLGEYQDYFDKRKTDHVVQQEKIESEAFLPAADFVKRISQSRVKRVVAPEETYRTPQKINWESINKNWAKTGMKGEEIVVEVEQEFFRSISRDDLAEKVRHVSKEDGDGSGYDVLSFFPDESEKYIEVKSTTGTLESPFYISRNELGFLQEHNKDAFVYRVQLSHDNDDVYLQSLTSSEVLLANEIIPVQYLVKL